MNRLALSANGDTIHPDQLPFKPYGRILLVQCFTTNVAKHASAELPIEDSIPTPRHMGPSTQFLTRARNVGTGNLIDELQKCCSYRLVSVTLTRTWRKSSRADGSQTKFSRYKLQFLFTTDVETPVTTPSNFQEAVTLIGKGAWDEVNGYDNGADSKVSHCITLKGYSLGTPSYILSAAAGHLDLVRAVPSTIE